MKKLLLLVFLISGFIFQACEEDEEVCQSTSYTQIIDSRSPDTVELNLSEYVQIAYTLENSCGDINFLQIDSLGDDTLSFQVRAIYEGCDCSEVLLTDTISYFYTPLDAGRKFLKFVSPDSSFFYDTLFVVDPEG